MNLREKYLGILQEKIFWGTSRDEIEEYYNKVKAGVIEFNSLLPEELLGVSFSPPKTKLVKENSPLQSGFRFPNSLEEPIVELFFDVDNYVIFSTVGIYTKRSGIPFAVRYVEIQGFDERSIASFFANKNEIFKDISIFILGNHRIKIAMEDGVPIRALLYFINHVRKG